MFATKSVLVTITLSLLSVSGCYMVKKDSRSKKNSPSQTECKDADGMCPEVVEDPIIEEAITEAEEERFILKHIPFEKVEDVRSELIKRNKGFWVREAPFPGKECEAYFNVDHESFRYWSVVSCLEDGKINFEYELGLITNMYRGTQRSLFSVSPLYSSCLADDKQHFASNRYLLNPDFIEIPQIYNPDFDAVGQLLLRSADNKTMSFNRAVATMGIDTKYCEDLLEFPEESLSRPDGMNELVTTACSAFNAYWETFNDEIASGVVAGCFEKNGNFRQAQVVERVYDEVR